MAVIAVTLLLALSAAWGGMIAVVGARRGVTATEVNLAALVVATLLLFAGK